MSENGVEKQFSIEFPEVKSKNYLKIPQMKKKKGKTTSKPIKRKVVKIYKKTDSGYDNMFGVNYFGFLGLLTQTKIGKEDFEEFIAKNPHVQKAVLEITKKYERKFNLSKKKTLLNYWSLLFTSIQYDVLTTQGKSFNYSLSSLSKFSSVVRYKAYDYFKIQMQKKKFFKVDLGCLIKWVTVEFKKYLNLLYLLFKKRISQENLNYLISLNILYYEVEYGNDLDLIIKNNQLLRSMMETVTGINDFSCICACFDASEDKYGKKYSELHIRFPKSFVNSNSPFSLFQICGEYLGQGDNDCTILNRISRREAALFNQFLFKIVVCDYGAVYDGAIIVDSNGDGLSLGNCAHCSAKNRHDFKSCHLKQETFQEIKIYFVNLGGFTFFICILHLFENVMTTGFIKLLTSRSSSSNIDSLVNSVKDRAFNGLSFSIKKNDITKRYEMNMFTLTHIKTLKENFNELCVVLGLTEDEKLFFVCYYKLYDMLFCSYKQKIKNWGSIQNYLSNLGPLCTQFADVCFLLEIISCYVHEIEKHLLIAETFLCLQHLISHFEICNCAPELKFKQNKVDSKNKFTSGAQRVGKQMCVEKDFVTEIASFNVMFNYLLTTPPSVINSVKSDDLKDLKETYLTPHLKLQKIRRVPRTPNQPNQQNPPNQIVHFNMNTCGGSGSENVTPNLQGNSTRKRKLCFITPRSSFTKNRKRTYKKRKKIS